MSKNTINNRNDKHEYNDYNQLKKIILKKAILVNGLIILGAIILFNMFFYDNIANFIVGLLCFIFRWSFEESLSIYNLVIRSNIDLIINLLLFILFMTTLIICINEFINYLSEINRGISELTHDNDNEIELMPELLTTQNKLNEIKRNIATNKHAAQEAERKKNDLVVYLAHDLKTPLTSVIGYITLIKDEKNISEETRNKYLNITLDKSLRLEELINEFFDITRFNLTNLVLEYKKTNISRMLEQICNEFTPIMQEKNITFELELDEAVEIVCDSDKLLRVFDNLLRNASNYSYNDSKVIVKLKKRNDYIDIMIKNHGKTIPKEKLVHVFDQFFRLDSSRNTVSGGAGLGLAIAKEIIERHKGIIGVKSVDESITFIIKLPIKS